MLFSLHFYRKFFAGLIGTQSITMGVFEPKISTPSKWMLFSLHFYRKFFAGLIGTQSITMGVFDFEFVANSLLETDLVFEHVVVDKILALFDNLTIIFSAKLP